MQASTVVGYSTKASNEGSQIVGAAFRNVGQTSFCLNDFRPTGYENMDYYLEQEGVKGSDISLMLIDSQGGSAGDFFFRRKYEDGVWQDESEAYWRGSTGETYAGGEGLGADEVFLNPGEGVWLTFNEWEEGCGLRTSGEVVVDAINTPCVEGSQLIANPLAKTITLRDIKPYGYENMDYYLEQEGVKGSDISVMLIDAQGASAGDFFFRRKYEDGQWQDESEAYWRGSTGETYPGGEGLADDEVELVPGESVWVTYNEWGEGCGIKFPGLND